MLKNFVAPVAAQRLRSGCPDVDLDAFCVRLVDLGYRPPTVRHKLWIVAHLTRWMAGKRVAIAHLDEHRVEECIDARRQSGRTCRGFRRTLLQLLEQLRAAGVVPTPESVCDESPAAVLLARYEAYLRSERALVDCTVTGYLWFVRAFIAECLSGDRKCAVLLHPDHVRDFLLERAQRMAPKRAQYLACALRSFLHFLFLRGETRTDLALAVPTIRQWRQSYVPRHLPDRDVERLLGACDRTGATGRRDHAVLLLLARLGLRAGEVIALELRDLRWREGEIVVRGKGLVHDRLPMPRDVGDALALYLRKDRPPCESRRVFLRRRAPHHGLAHASSVTTIVRRALARAGLAPPTRGAHLLRHSLASSMLRCGASLTEIGQVLRHRSPNTTEIYAKLDFDALRDVAMPWPTTGGVR